jgi:hypothetical protein
MASARLTLIRPGDDEYDDARRSFNATIQSRPAIIAKPSSS